MSRSPIIPLTDGAYIEEIENLGTIERRRSARALGGSRSSATREGQTVKRAKIGFRAGLGFTMASFLGSACVPPGDVEVTGRLGVEVAEVEQSSPTALLFEEAAARWDVPVDLLKALAYSETGLEPAVGEVEFEGQEQPFGLLALRGTELERAAALAGYTPERVMGDDAANVDAAAALLDAYARAVGLDDALRKEPGMWKHALERWGGIEDADHRREFAEGVLAHLARGLAVRARPASARRGPCGAPRPTSTAAAAATSTSW
jgi:hypothetical protein